MDERAEVRQTMRRRGLGTESMTGGRRGRANASCGLPKKCYHAPAHFPCGSPYATSDKETRRKNFTAIPAPLLEKGGMSENVICVY